MTKVPAHSPIPARSNGGSRVIRIIVAEDQAIVRRGIASLLTLTSAFDVTGEAENGIEAVEMAKRLLPDLVLMDFAMPLLNGVDAAVKIKAAAPQVKIIMLSAHDGQEYVRRALASGADGYMLKNASPESLAHAVCTVTAGNGKFYSPSFSDETIKALRAKLKRPSRQGSDLTPREREVLQLIAEGRSHQEIAGLLQVSVRTIDTHRNNLMQKLKIHDAVALVRYAVKAGLTEI